MTDDECHAAHVVGHVFVYMTESGSGDVTDLLENNRVASRGIGLSIMQLASQSKCELIRSVSEDDRRRHDRKFPCPSIPPTGITNATSVKCVSTFPIETQEFFSL
jgi:hypothetical protein